MWPIDLLYICSNDEFRKKAGISFGIQFDTHKYKLLLSCLEDIIIHKDRVSLKINIYRFEPYKKLYFKPKQSRTNFSVVGPIHIMSTVM